MLSTLDLREKSSAKILSECDGDRLWHSLKDVHALQIFHIENCFFLHLFHAGFIMMDEIPMFQHVTFCDLE